MSFEPHQRPNPLQQVADVVSATHELAACNNRDDLLHDAVELLRYRVGLERVAIFVSEPNRPSYELYGTWGTSLRGETIDERALRHECSIAENETLGPLQPSGSLWIYRERVPYVVNGAVVGHGWLALTPIVAGDELLGVMYNDTATTLAPIDDGKQVVAAMFSSLLAGLLVTKRVSPGFVSKSTEAAQNHLVRKVLECLEREPTVTGDQLARRFGVSPGYLARSFKQLMGVSLVEYRNRLRLQRFLDAVRDGETSLLQAALEAGFGSYAQFHRVHRKLLGTSPALAKLQRKPDTGQLSADVRLAARSSRRGRIA